MTEPPDAIDAIEQPPAWERRPDESEPAHAAFQVYERQPSGDRSLRRVATEVGKDFALIGRWSSAHGWTARVAAWDLHQDRIRQRAHEQAILAMSERHAQLATAFQGKIVERLRAIQPAELSPADLVRWFEVASKVERLARGLDGSQRMEVTGAGGGPVKVEPEVTSDFVAEVLARLGQAGGEPPEEGPG